MLNTKSKSNKTVKSRLSRIARELLSGKKIFVILLSCALSATAFAQTEKTTDEPKGEPAPAGLQVQKAPAHECYTMKEGQLMHCMGAKAESQKGDVTLKNGTVITAKGQVNAKDGKKQTLANGECVDLAGAVSDCAKLHADIKPDPDHATDDMKQDSK